MKPDSPLGAHVSIAGGLELAVQRGVELRCTAIQIFSRNSNQWAIRPLDPDVQAAWREALARHPMRVMVHGSYLINLASPDPGLRERSRTTFLADARRCAALGIPQLVFHPGAHMGGGERAGLERVARALDWILRRLDTPIPHLLLENTAGQGTTLGHRLDHLARIRESVEQPDRLGVCIDTCHLFAAGYDIRTDAAYRSTFDEVTRLLGAETVQAFHLNDSKRELGSHVDRHENIGRGRIGSRAFRLLLNDPRFRSAPKVIETPKAGDMDRKNLALLRRLSHPAPA